MRTLGIVVVVALCAIVAGARLARSQSHGSPPAGAAAHQAIAPDDLRWGEAPPALPKGAKMAVLAGDPTKSGLFVVRLKVPAGYKIMPHSHPTDENLTIISGSFGAGMGDKLEANVKAMPAGSFFHMPAQMHHFAVAKSDAVIEIAAMGPFVITYVDPTDDPSKKQAAATH